MKRKSVRLRGTGLGVILLFLAVTVFAGSGVERTLFKDIPPSDPARQVIQSVLASPLHSMRGGFPGREWAEAGYRDSWERARRYFPGRTYFVRPGTYFMTHGYGPGGGLFMEIHESAFLTLCVENCRTFAAGSTVGEYGRMLGAPDGREASAFRDKMGRLEPFFRGDAADRVLRKTLGESGYLGLLKAFREENYHMLAGGLMHEGMHAGLDDPLAARIQADFKAGERPVQWDEMRAFMAEAGYHGPRCAWAEAEIRTCWERAYEMLGRLETLRKRASLRSGKDRTRFEKSKAGAWAQAALIRLRMREIWQSAQRMQDLVAGFRKDYVEGRPPAEVDRPLAALAQDTGAFAAGAGEAIQATELALRSLEEIFDPWSEWADGRRLFPPPVTDSNAIVRRAREIRWPAPPAGAAVLMELARRALDEARASLKGDPRPPTSSRRPGFGPASSA
jgi:hypothetical protein